MTPRPPPRRAQPAQEAPKEAPKKEAPKEPTNATTGTIKMQQKFYCRPEDIFDALFNPGKVRHYTQADCSVSKAEGADVSARRDRAGTGPGLTRKY